MATTIILNLFDDDMNRWNIEILNELLDQIGVEMDVEKSNNNIQLHINYNRQEMLLLRKRNAGRKCKYTNSLTNGEVEELLKTLSVKELAEKADISLATCYRRISKLKKYQEEAKVETNPEFKDMYKSMPF